VPQIFTAAKECTREDRIRKESIRDELQIHSIKKKRDKTKIKFREHTARMKELITKSIVSYILRGRRLQGRPQKSYFS
jgi:hypothetical protein